MSAMQSVSIGEMVAQSRDVITNPSVSTFERYEKRGSLGNAAVYIVVASVLAAVLGLIEGLLPGGRSPLQGLLGGLLGALIQFFIFTGMVYFLGKNLASGSGTWDEVAYTFSLFSAPLIVIGAALSLVFGILGLIPILNILTGFIYFLISLVIMVVQAYFAYLAVQSSMNIHDQTRALITLVAAVLGSLILTGIVGSLLIFI